MIIISPFAKSLRDGRFNPKNYPIPLWKELIELLHPHNIVQVGTNGEEQLVSDFRTNLSLFDLGQLVSQCKTWIGVDSFFQHFAWDLKKYGVVLWGQSDPNIFGHPENINLLKDRKYLRNKQFWWWEQCEYRNDCWVDPEDVFRNVNFLLTKYP